MQRNQAIKSAHVMTTQQAQDMLDRNAETIKEIIRLQDDPSLPDAAERKERLQARLHRRLLKLSRWCDTSDAERKRADDKFELKQQKALDSVLAHGDNVKQSARKLLAKQGKGKGQSIKYEGVFVDKTGKWVAQISAGGKTHFLGRYNTEEEAAIAWGKACQAPANEGADAGKVKLGDKVVDLRAEDRLRDMNYANAKARGVTPAQPPPVPPPLKVTANAIPYSQTVAHVGGGGSGGQKRSYSAAMGKSGGKAAPIFKMPQTKKATGWKPFNCPDRSCSKAYTHQRKCANHPELMCITYAELRQRYMADAMRESSSSSEESDEEEEDDDDEEDDDEEDDEEIGGKATGSSEGNTIPAAAVVAETGIGAISSNGPSSSSSTQSMEPAGPALSDNVAAPGEPSTAAAPESMDVA